MIISLTWILYITAKFNNLSFSKHILCRQTCIQIHLLQNPYENLRTNELALCSLFSNYCTYQRKPSVVFVLLSFRETDHIEASWKRCNYETKRLFTQYGMKEQIINLFSFSPSILDTVYHEFTPLLFKDLCCIVSFFIHLYLPVLISLFHFSVSFLCAVAMELES